MRSGVVLLLACCVSMSFAFMGGREEKDTDVAEATVAIKCDVCKTLVHSVIDTMKESPFEITEDMILDHFEGKCPGPNEMTKPKFLMNKKVVKTGRQFALVDVSEEERLNSPMIQFDWTTRAMGRACGEAIGSAVEIMEVLYATMKGKKAPNVTIKNPSKLATKACVAAEACKKDEKKKEKKPKAATKQNKAPKEQEEQQKEEL